MYFKPTNNAAIYSLFLITLSNSLVDRILKLTSSKYRDNEFILIKLIFIGNGYPEKKIPQT